LRRAPVVIPLSCIGARPLSGPYRHARGLPTSQVFDGQCGPRSTALHLARAVWRISMRSWESEYRARSIAGCGFALTVRPSRSGSLADGPCDRGSMCAGRRRLAGGRADSHYSLRHARMLMGGGEAGVNAALNAWWIARAGRARGTIGEASIGSIRNPRRRPADAEIGLAPVRAGSRPRGRPRLLLGDRGADTAGWLASCVRSRGTAAAGRRRAADGHRTRAYESSPEPVGGTPVHAVPEPCVRSPRPSDPVPA
jgi:hypothetical protein